MTPSLVGLGDAPVDPPEGEGVFAVPDVGDPVLVNLVGLPVEPAPGVGPGVASETLVGGTVSFSLVGPGVFT